MSTREERRFMIALKAMETLIAKIPLHDSKCEYGTNSTDEGVDAIRRGVADSSVDYADKLLEAFERAGVEVRVISSVANPEANATYKSPDVAGVLYADLFEMAKTGWLHEVNRQFFHPIGVGLEIQLDPDDPTRAQMRMWHTFDLEGMRMGHVDPKKVLTFAKHQQTLLPDRIKKLGYWVQPSPIGKAICDPFPADALGGRVWAQDEKDLGIPTVDDKGDSVDRLQRAFRIARAKFQNGSTEKDVVSVSVMTPMGMSTVEVRRDGTWKMSGLVPPDLLV